MDRRYPYEGGLAPKSSSATSQPSASMRFMDSLTLMLPEEAKRSVMSKHSAWGGSPHLITLASKKLMKPSSVMDWADRLMENTDGTRIHSLRLLVSQTSKVRTTQRSILGMRRCCAALAKNSAGCTK